MADQPQPLAGATFRDAYRKALAARGRQQRNKRGRRAAATVTTRRRPRPTKEDK